MELSCLEETYVIGWTNSCDH